MTTQVLQKSVNEAVQALQAGENERARKVFQSLLLGQEPELEPARRNLQLWMGLAYACGNCNDSSGAIAAVDRALALDSRNAQALLFKADHLWHVGEEDNAAIFYQSLLRAAQSMDPVPPELAAQLSRAEQRAASVANRQLGYLRQELASLGIDGNSVSGRFGQALSISLGDKQFYPQQPSKFFFPELPHIQFFSPAQFAWAGDLQAATATIKNELQQALAQQVEFEPYLQESAALPRSSATDMWGSSDWGALYLWKDGELNDVVAADFPDTVRLLRQLPLADIPGASPNVLFSRLKPGVTIPAHHGFFNTRLICHLPLIIPENCGHLRVGNESRVWREGELLIFDDSIEHEACNHSQQDRIVLIFEIWRPELSEPERDAIRRLLTIIRRYGADKN